jgi:hypothetical protein
MKAWMRVVSIIAGLTASVVVAVNLAAFLEMDTCLDAGGRYIERTGACDIDRADYVPLFSRPGIYAFWTLFLGGCAIVGWGVFKILASAFTKLSSPR